jgi:hypothetical protein
LAATPALMAESSQLSATSDRDCPVDDFHLSYAASDAARISFSSSAILLAMAVIAMTPQRAAAVG